jgi:hypothetical protein
MYVTNALYTPFSTTTKNKYQRIIKINFTINALLNLPVVSYIILTLPGSIANVAKTVFSYLLKMLLLSKSLLHKKDHHFSPASITNQRKNTSKPVITFDTAPTKDDVHKSTHATYATSFNFGTSTTAKKN